MAQFQLGKFSRNQWPLVSFDSTNSLCFFHSVQEQTIFVYETASFTVLKTFPSNQLGSVSISAVREGLYISNVQIQVFLYWMNNALKKCLQLSTQQSKWQIYSYDDPTYVFEAQLNPTNEVQQIWSPDAKYLLIWTQQLDDETNQSYYGLHTLYHFDLAEKQLTQIRVFEGPIHDLGWNSKSGFMPAGTVLYDKHGVQQYLISQHHVNALHWNPDGVHACLAGFGNLAGDIEVWNIADLKKVGQCKKDKVVSFQWSSCGKYFLTATTFPRLRVDNSIQFYDLNAKLIHSLDYKDTELYEARWVPQANIQINPNLQLNNTPANGVQKTQVKQLSIQNAGLLFILQQTHVDFIKEMKNGMNNNSGPRKLSQDEALVNQLQIKQPQQDPQSKPKPQQVPQQQSIIQQTIMRRQPNQVQDPFVMPTQPIQSEEVVLTKTKKKLTLRSKQIEPNHFENQ